MLQIKKISSSGISSGIPEEMKWLQMVHTVDLHTKNYLPLFKNHKNQKPMPLNHIYCKSERYLPLGFPLGFPLRSQRKWNDSKWYIRWICIPKIIYLLYKNHKKQKLVSQNHIYVANQKDIFLWDFLWDSRGNEMVPKGTYGEPTHHESLHLVGIT